MCKYLRWDNPPRFEPSFEMPGISEEKKQQLKRDYRRLINCPGEYVREVEVVDNRLIIILAQSR